MRTSVVLARVDTTPSSAVHSLRLRGIPARARCGFATYFMVRKGVDHWIVEHWRNACELAERAELTRNYISDLVRGLKSPSLNLDRGDRRRSRDSAARHRASRRRATIVASCAGSRPTVTGNPERTEAVFVGDVPSNVRDQPGVGEWPAQRP